MTVKTTFLEGLHEAAKKRAAAAKGISFALAYGEILQENPTLYSAAIRERDSHTPGTSAAKAYLRAVERVQAESRAVPL